MKATKTLEQRLDEKTDRSAGPDACWLWTGSTLLTGYGLIGVKTPDGWKIRKASRIIWALVYGPIPYDKVVCHSCDNPRCVNPKHFWLGTQQQNVDDMMAKNRGNRSFCGEAHPRSKLTNIAVTQLRTDFAAGKYKTYKAAGTVYGISGVMVRLIVLHKTWTHIP